MADPWQPQPYRIVRRDWETNDTVTFELEPFANVAPKVCAPGQFNMLYAFGIGEVPISVSGVGSGEGAMVHTVRAVGPVTKALVKAQIGDMVGLRGPFGTSWPVAEAKGRDVLLIAGGLGLAPLWSTLDVLSKQSREYGELTLLYGARSPDGLLYRNGLEDWSNSSDVNVLLTVDIAQAQWPGNIGPVTSLFPGAPFDVGNGIAMICGPELMMRFAVAALESMGMEQERIYLSLERNMKCAVGLCGRCQYGPTFICKDGPVVRYDRIAPFYRIADI